MVLSVICCDCDALWRANAFAPAIHPLESDAVCCDELFARAKSSAAEEAES
jgi:hypothetical protein